MKSEDIAESFDLNLIAEVAWSKPDWVSKDSFDPALLYFPSCVFYGEPIEAIFLKLAVLFD